MNRSSHPRASASDVLRRVKRGAQRINRGSGLRGQPRPVWASGLAGVFGLGYLPVAYFALRMFDVPSGFHGWLPSALGYAPGVLLVVFGTGLGRWPVATAGAAGAALAMGSCTYYVAPPIHERIEAEAMNVGVPAGWSVVNDGTWGGNTWGLWNDWPEVGYTYTTSNSAREAAEQYAELLETKGWEQDTIGDRTEPSPGTVAQAWKQGRWNVQVRVAGPGSEPRSFDRLVPAALTQVDLYSDGQR